MPVRLSEQSALYPVADLAYGD